MLPNVRPDVGLSSPPFYLNIVWSRGVDVEGGGVANGAAVPGLMLSQIKPFHFSTYF